MMGKKKTNVLILGTIRGKYRSNYIIDVFTKDPRDGEYIVSFVTPGYSTGKIDNSNDGRKKSLKIFLLLFEIIPTWIDFIYKLFFTDIIYLLPLNHSQANKIAFVKLFFPSIIIISELYISVSDTYLDRTSKKNFSSFRYKTLQRRDRVLIEQSDYLIHTSIEELKIIAKDVGAIYKKDRIIIIPQSVPTLELAIPSESEVFRIAYWGQFQPMHGVDAIIDAMSILKKSNFKFKLTLFGLPEPKKLVELYKSKIIDLDLQNEVILRTDASFGNGLLGEYLKYNVDLALGQFGNASQKSKVCLVTKIIDAMSMQLPVLTRKTVMIEELIDIEREIFVCDTDPNAIASAIISISDNRILMNEVGRSGYKKWHNQLSEESFKQKLQSFLTTLRSN